MATTYDCKLPRADRAGYHMLRVGTDAAGAPAVVFSGFATSDATIVAEVGVDALWADGSLYLAVTAADHTTMAVWRKTNNTWTLLS